MINDLHRSRPAIILLAEDNDNDVELTRLGFKKSKLAVDLHTVRDGEECMAYLRKQNRFADAPTPDLVLLDLNMPKMSGRQVLEEVGKDPSLRHIPVVVLTTSADEREVLEMYARHCNSYIVKPINFEQLKSVIQGIADYWFTVVVLPTNDQA